MIEVIESRFEGVRVELDGFRYLRCTFQHCQIVYSGGSFNMDGCTMEDSVFVFDGAAGRTIEFLKSMIAMPGGEELVESTFDYKVTVRPQRLQ